MTTIVAQISAGRNGRRIQTEAAISAQRKSTASVRAGHFGSLGFIGDHMVIQIQGFPGGLQA
jgi:hypothetical protein